MSNQFDYKCPQCGCAGDLEIAASVWVCLTADGTDADMSENGDHVWDDNSEAACQACGWSGKVLALASQHKGGGPFSVLLLYPSRDDTGGPETYYQHYTAADAAEAVEQARAQASEHGEYDPDDFDLLAVFDGHINMAYNTTIPTSE